MRRAAQIRHGCVWALIGAAALIALVPWQGIIWDGGFRDVECRLKFVDGDGKPVPGVTLSVFTKAGGVCHFYPVDEFVPDRPVVSDAEGQMVFHHSSKFLEFAGREYSNLLGMRFGETSAPHYECVFLHGEREICRTRYNFHEPEWDKFRRPVVTREWEPPWSLEKYGPGPTEEDGAWRMRLFDSNRDGKLDREEATACSYFIWMINEKPGERTYLVVERTIVVPNP
jgi:hypothetical protein